MTEDCLVALEKYRKRYGADAWASIRAVQEQVMHMRGRLPVRQSVHQALDSLAGAGMIESQTQETGRSHRYFWRLPR
jgi:hypothetical protein